MNRQDGTNLIDQVIDHDNLYMAYKHVRANKGAPGIDGITVDELYGHMQQYYSSLRRKVRDGSYQPQPVRRAEIKKDDGSKRKIRDSLCIGPCGAASYLSGHCTGNKSLLFKT